MERDKRLCLIFDTSDTAYGPSNCTRKVFGHIISIVIHSIIPRILAPTRRTEPMYEVTSSTLGATEQARHDHQKASDVEEV